MDMDLLAAKVSELAGFVWNGLLLYLLVGTGIIFTIRTRFIQVRKFGAGFRRLFGSVNLNGEKAGKEGMSSFQAVATSIAAQVGTGNITGCATAMISGGPGAIFWMWLAAFFGMATIYGEAVLAQTFKTKDETGHVIGGPVYYIRQAFKGTFGKILAGFFALAIIFALGFTGNMVQSNAISNAFQEVSDAVVVAGYYQEGGLILKKMRDMGMNQPVLGDNGFMSPELVKIAGPAADNVYVSSMWSPDRDSEATKKGAVYWVPRDSF